MDFEEKISEQLNIDADDFKRSADYLLLRANFQDRWDTLNEFKDYPHMLTPLEIS